MAFRLPRRPNRGHAWLGGRGGFVAAALLIAFAGSAIRIAEAQVVVGDNRAPSVSVDNSVLDSLGPSPTLPQYFGARAPSAPRMTPPATTATRSATSHHTQKRRVASQRSKPRAEAVSHRRVATAEKPHSSLNEVIHLKPPVASVAPVPSSSALAQTTKPAQQQATTKVSGTTQQKLEALASPVPKPAPLPPLPTTGEIPTTPALPPQPAHDVTPTPASTPAAAAPTQNVAAVPAPATTAPVPAPAPAETAATTPPPTPAPAPVTSAAPVTSTTPTPLTPSAPATSPAVAAAAAPSPAAPPVQMAAATTTGNGISAINFGAGVTDLSSGPQPALDAIAARLIADDNLRVQVVAHATGKPDDAMEARRVSLARAVAVRAYLIDKGVRSLRIDVRALGNRADDGPVADQVDLMLVSQ